MDSQQIDLPPPKNWQDLQDLCHALWELEWGCPSIQKNGRAGQKQRGVDVFGVPAANTKYHGIQCKVKSTDAARNPELTEDEITGEVNQAKIFAPPLERLIIATTAPQDAKIQSFARKLSEQHASQGLFSVEVAAWPEIQARLAKHESLLERFYSGSSTRLKLLSEQTTTIHTLTIGIDSKIDTQSDKLNQILSRIDRLDTDRTGIDEVINRQIDQCRDLMMRQQSATAVRLLEELEKSSTSFLTSNAKFRIATNIGAAKLQLGQFEDAGRALIQAWQFSQGTEKADGNRAFGFLLVGDIDQAEKLAAEAAARHPTSGKPIAVLISCAVRKGTLTDPIAFVPENMRDDPEVILAVAGGYRWMKNGDEAVAWAERLYALEPSLRNRRYRAESLLARLDTPAVTLGGQLTADRKRDLSTACEDLEACWTGLHGTEEARGDLSVGAMLITCLMLSGELSRARAVVDQVLSIDQGFEPTLKQAIVLASEEKKFEAALELGQRLKKLPERSTLIAEALLELRRFDEARTVLDTTLAETVDTNVRRYASTLRLYLEFETGDSRSATEMAEQLHAASPDELRTKILLAENHIRFDRPEEAAKLLESSIATTTIAATYEDKLVAAGVLIRLKRYRVAARVLSSLIETREDSPLLRDLFRSLVKADLREDLDAELRKLSDETLKIPFYAHTKAHHLDSVGRRADAFAFLSKHLERSSGDSDARLHWMQLADDLDLVEPLVGFLKENFDLPWASPIQRMGHAQCLKRRGFPEEGLRLGYELLRKNRSDANINLGFIGLMFLEPQLELDMKAIEVDASVELANGRVYTIEAGEIVDATGEVSPNHTLAEQWRGRVVGDEVVISSNPYQSQTVRVTGITHKYVRAHREVLSNFSVNFPGHPGLMQFSLDSESPPQSKAIEAVLDDQAKEVEAALETYRTGAPICLVASLLGQHPIRVWQSLIQKQDPPLRCSIGSQEEANKAYAALQENDAGFVVDPLTLHVLDTLDLLDSIPLLGRPVGVSRTTIESLKKLSVSLAEHSTDGMKILTRDSEGLLARIIPADVIADSIRRIERIIKWISDNCDLLDASGDVEMTSEARDALSDVDVAFIDTIRAAVSSDRILIADDLHYRRMAQLMGVRHHVGIEHLGRFCVFVGALEFGNLATALENMILANYQIVSLDADMLRHAAERDAWRVTPRLSRMLGELGRPTIEFTSAANVAIQVVGTAILNVSEDDTREKFVSAVVEAFAPNFSNRIPELRERIHSALSTIILAARENARRAELIARTINVENEKGEDNAPIRTDGSSAQSDDAN